jgi:hypothetical protein
MAAVETATEIRPFQVHVREAELDDLRRRNLLLPPETTHAVKNVGSGNAAELATYLVEEGKPFLVVLD